MKVLSNPTVYAIRAMVYMASNSREGSYVSIRQISDTLSISFHLLTKTFQQLTSGGILTSYRGPGGGIAFQRPHEEIRLIDIVHLLEGADFFDTCLLGLPGCGVAEPCPVHNLWAKVKTELELKMKTTTLADLQKMEGRIL